MEIVIVQAGSALTRAISTFQLCGFVKAGHIGRSLGQSLVSMTRSVRGIKSRIYR